MTSPCGTVVHVHGNLDVLGVLLAGGQVFDFLQAGLVGLACGHAAVDGDGAGVCNRAAGGRGVEDLAGGAGASAEETRVFPVLGVVLRVEHLDKTLDFLVVCRIVFVEVADIQDDFRHLVDRVVAALGRRAVAGNTVHVDADFHSAAMTAIDAAVGRLGGDDELNLISRVFRTVKILVDDGLPAHAVAVFFLHGADDHDLVALGNETQILHDLAAVSCGCHAAFLIGTAAAVDDIVGLITLIGVGFPVGAVADADGVDVRVNGNDLVAGAHPADDVAELVELNLVVAELRQLFGDALDNALFLTGLGRNGDHIAQELCHIGFVALGCLLDCFIVHNTGTPCYINYVFLF